MPAPRWRRPSIILPIPAIVVGLAILVVQGCNSEAASDAGKRAGRKLTPVVVTMPFEREFVDRLEALGTARARESVVITAQVTETVQRLAFEDGASVEAGQVLAELTSAEETAQLAVARANHADAKMRYDRVADLAERGTESQSRFDEVRSALEAAEARLAELKARRSDRKIRAPFSGVLGLREVSPGTLLKPGDRITTLDDIDRIKVDFSVPETFLAVLHPGLEIATRTAAYPGRAFEGRVEAIDSRVDPSTRAVRARAVIGNADHALKPGMLLTLVLRANPSRGLALAEQALVPRGMRQFVVLVEGEVDGEAGTRRVEVEIGRREPGLVEVLSGLEPDSRVIAEGANLVPPGGRVRVMREDAPGQG